MYRQIAQLTLCQRRSPSTFQSGLSCCSSLFWHFQRTPELGWLLRSMHATGPNIHIAACMHGVCVCALLHEATTSLYMCHDCMCVGPTCSDVMLEPSVLTAAKYCMANLVASVLPAPLSPLYSTPVECGGS